MSGSVESGPPDADAHALEVRRRRARGLQRLQPVVAGQPAAEARADRRRTAGRSRRARRARGRGRACRSRAPGRRSGRPRSCRSAASSTATRGPPGPGAALGDSPGELLLGRGSSQRARELVGDLEADVVRRARVARARVAEPDDQPVDRGRAAPKSRRTRPRYSELVAGGVVAAASPSPSAARPRAPRRPRRPARSRSRSPRRPLELGLASAG